MLREDKKKNINAVSKMRNEKHFIAKLIKTRRKGPLSFIYGSDLMIILNDPRTSM